MTEPSPFRRVEFPPIPADHWMLNPDGWEDILATHVASARLALGVERVTAYIGVPAELLDDMVTINFRPSTPEEIALGEQQRAAWEAKRKAEHATAVADWRELRTRYAHSPAVLAVLDIHRPDPDGALECTHAVSGYEADAEDWPCETYTAIRDAPA